MSSTCGGAGLGPASLWGGACLAITESGNQCLLFSRFFTPKDSEVPIPWVYTECFVEDSTDDSPVPPARQPPASTLPWQTPPCSSPDLPIPSQPPVYTFHWASTQPAQHNLCVRQPNQTHHLHRQRTNKKKEKKHTESGSWCSPQSVLQFHSHRQYT